MPEFQFTSFAEFLSMGGHAVYVWSSYAVFAAMIAFNLIQPVLARRKIIRVQQARLRRETVRSNSTKNSAKTRQEEQ